MPHAANYIFFSMLQSENNATYLCRKKSALLGVRFSALPLFHLTVCNFSENDLNAASESLEWIIPRLPVHACSYKRSELGTHVLDSA